MNLHPSEYKLEWENNVPISLTMKDHKYEIKSRTPVSNLNEDSYHIYFRINQKIYSLHFKSPDEIYQLTDITGSADFLKSQDYLHNRDKNYQKAYIIFNFFLEIFLKIDKFTSNITFSEEQNDIQLVVPFNVKIMRHLLSVIVIVEERNKILKHLDYDAIKILMRVIFECINVHNYLFIGRTKMEMDLYISSWRLISLKDSIELFEALNERKDNLYTSSKEGILNFEKIFSDKISKSPLFEKLDIKSKNKLLKGNWKLSKKNSELGYWLGLNPKFINHKYSSFCSAIHNDSHSIAINTTYTPFQDFVDYSIINDFHFLIFILAKYLTNVFDFYRDNMPVFFTSCFEFNLMKDEKVAYVIQYAKDIEKNYDKNNADLYKS